MLTSAKVRKAKPKDRDYKMYDSLGLYLLVTKKGSKLWRFAYKYNGKQKLLSLGPYPEVTLSEARKKRTELRKQLLNGLDPAEVRKRKKMEKELTFDVVAREFFEHMSQTNWSEGHAKKQKIRIDRHIIPHLGVASILNVTTADVLDLVKKVETITGAATARRIYTLVNQIFRFALIKGYIQTNPAEPLARSGFLPREEKRHMPATLDLGEIGRILRLLDCYDGIIFVKAAIRILPLVFVRPGELVKMRWEEVNLEEGSWVFKASKTLQEHYVPLSRQAISILRELDPFRPMSPWVFQSLRPGRHISAQTLNAALQTLGIDTRETLTSHGWRAIARTLLVEKLGYDPELVELQLAHSVPDRLGRAYNRVKFLKERRRMMQDWADFLEQVKKK